MSYYEGQSRNPALAKNNPFDGGITAHDASEENEDRAAATSIFEDDLGIGDESSVSNDPAPGQSFMEGAAGYGSVEPTGLVLSQAAAGYGGVSPQRAPLTQALAGHPIPRPIAPEPAFNAQQAWHFIQSGGPWPRIVRAGLRRLGFIGAQNNGAAFWSNEDRQAYAMWAHRCGLVPTEVGIPTLNHLVAMQGQVDAAVARHRRSRNGSLRGFGEDIVLEEDVIYANPPKTNEVSDKSGKTRASDGTVTLAVGVLAVAGVAAYAFFSSRKNSR